MKSKDLLSRFGISVLNAEEKDESTQLHLKRKGGIVLQVFVQQARN